MVSKLSSWELEPNAGLKRILITVDDSSDSTDTLEIVLTDYGISATGLLAVTVEAHTTNGSIMVTEASTTAVSGGTLTVTLATNANAFRVIELIGRSDKGVFA